MLRALGHPLSFLALLVGFLLAVVLSRAAQLLALRVAGQRTDLKDASDVRRALDPYGAVAGLLAGPGWGSVAIPTGIRPPLGRVLALLAGPVVVGAVGLGVLSLYDRTDLLPLLGPSAVLNGVSGSAAQVIVLCVGLQMLGMAVLALVPLPPLPGWAVLDRLAPRSPNWDKARFWLVERSIGVVVLLVLLLFPLGGGVPLLLSVVDGLSGLLLGGLW